MLLIDVRCTHCNKLHCRISHNFFGVVEFICGKCNEKQTLSLASILRQAAPELGKIGHLPK